MNKFKPTQHPHKLDSSDNYIVSYKVPPKNLTPYNHVPDLARADNELVF